MTSALVTGGAGFLGSHLIEALLKKGYLVYCLDNLYTGHLSNLEKVLDRIVFYKQDVQNPLPKVKVDVIFHLACPASPVHYQKDELFTINTSYFGTYNVLELAREINSEVIFTSTSEIYGDPVLHPQSESYFGNVNTLGPRSCYDEGKRAAETLCYIYHKKYAVPVKIVRIFNTYGPRMSLNDGRVVSNFIVKALRNEPLTVFGSGEQTRAFCYVDDLIEGLLRIHEYKRNFEVFNLGNDNEITVNKLAQMVIQLTGSKSHIVFNQSLEDDPFRRRPDLTKIKRAIGWEAKINLEEGLKKTIEYFRSVLTCES